MILSTRRSSAWIAGIFTLLLCLPALIHADDAGADTRFGMFIHASDDAMRNASQMDAAVAKILDNGFNLVVPQARAFGEVYYASDREPLSDKVEPGLNDPLGALITKVKAKNSAAAVMPSLQLLTAYSYFNDLTDDASGVLAANPGWVMVNAQGRLEDGDRQRYLDPAVPAVQDFLTEVVGEVARKYDVAGIIVEDFMYPDPAADWGFSPMAIEAWQQATGNAGRPSPDQPEWLEWRAVQLTALAERLRDAVHAARPGARLILTASCEGRAPVSAGDFANSAPWLRRGQNWAKWAQDGTADVILVDNQRRDSTEGEESRQWMGFASGLQSTATIGMNVSGKLNFPTGVASQMSLAQRHGAGLIVLHSLRQPVRGNEAQLYPLLKSIVFNAPRMFKPSGIRFEPPAPTPMPEGATTPTVALATPAPPDDERTSPTTMVQPPQPILDAMSPDEPPMTVEGRMPPAPEDDAAAPGATPAPTQPEGFVLPATPTPEPTTAPAVERRLPTQQRTDVLYLKNGQVVRGRFIDQVEGKVIFEQESGLQLNIPENQVEKIDRAL